MKPFISYIRVSTKRQGDSGLGLEAQQADVARHVNGHGRLIAEYREIETGKRADRPELAKALAHAKRAKATLVVAKLDRLARNMAFTATLMEAGVDFVACDNPVANRLTVHILAAVAEDEARRISDRTKAALLAFKARGGLLGAAHPRCPSLTRESSEKGRARSIEVNRERAATAYSDLIPIIHGCRQQGMSLAAIADRLNELGHGTRTGRPWNHVQVRRVLGRVT